MIHGIRGWLALVVITAAVASSIGARSAYGARYAFTTHEVLVQQASLQYTLNQGSLLHLALKLLGEPSPVPSTFVRCRGVEPVALVDGGSGFAEIRCTTSIAAMNDDLYSLNANPRLVTRRINPNSP